MKDEYPYDFKTCASQTYCWSAAPISNAGWASNSSLWFRTRREAKTYIRHHTYEARYWQLGRRVETLTREVAS